MRAHRWLFVLDRNPAITRPDSPAPKSMVAHTADASSAATLAVEMKRCAKEMACLHQAARSSHRRYHTQQENRDEMGDVKATGHDVLRRGARNDRRCRNGRFGY
jgi:hypothetical protein